MRPLSCPLICLLSLLPFLALTACGTTEPAEDNLLYAETASIRVTRAPTADFDAADVTTVTVEDASAIRAWRQTLSAIPEEPLKGVRMIKFLPNTVEYRIEFVGSNGEVVGNHRMKSTCLDVASHPGWAFYSGEDSAFTGLVTGLFAE